jgi:hypothetical protein
MEKKFMIFLVIGLIVLSVASVSAITGKIGNGRMILNFEPGEKIERSIRVINDNNVTINVSLSVSGDLQEDIEIIDSEFVLTSGDEKNAKFNIQTQKEGRLESRVNVQFTPEEGGNGVGLAAVVISNVKKNTSEKNEDKNNWKIYLGISGVLLIILIVLMFYSKKRGKKEGNETRIKKK